MPAVMEVSTPLEDGELLFRSLHAHEELSRLSEYRVELLSFKADINLNDLLGKSITVKVQVADDNTRYFSGYVTRIAYQGAHGRYHSYLAVVRPWLWFLTRTSDCRIFQEMTVPDIVKKVFADHDTADYDLQLTGTYRTWTYCVQYRETDFNFVSRLLEHEGIYYYFKHDDGRSTMVITDSYSGHSTFPSYENLPYISAGTAVRPEVEYVSAWEMTRALQPGVFVHDDYDMLRPTVELKTQKALVREHAEANYEIYDYPGQYLQTSDGQEYAAVRLDELAAQFEIAHAASNARGVCVGYLLTLEDHPRSDQNREYLITETNYAIEYAGYESSHGTDVTSCHCSFVAMSSQQQYRAPRVTPKPFVQGPQTAIVVGPSGEEIYTEKNGCVKVQFHWDRYGQRDENSSCWIRVSHPWAGKGWGSVAIPRIDQEVVVDFLEGDPDQPIVTGRVYNGDSPPPYSLPADAVVSGLKSNTVKGKGYNEVSMNDTAGKEAITIHGQYDMNTTVEHDQTNTVKNKFTETITSDATISVTQGNYSHDVQTGTAKYHVKGALTENYDVTQDTTIKNALTIKSTSGAITISADSQNAHVKAATTIRIEVGSSKITMDASGKISIEGTDVTVKGSTSVTIKGGIVHSEADSEHQTKGAIVLSDGSATNTVKGGMVMLNP
jgi:type VI secretion system secreted protein VgrG